MSDFDNIRRMCRSFKDCEGCLVGAFNGKVYGCSTDPSDPNSVWFNHWDQAKPLVDQWIEEHPVKTYLMDFKEKFPKSSSFQVEEDKYSYPCNSEWLIPKGIITACSIYGKSKRFNCKPLGCKECWDMEME